MIITTAFRGDVNDCDDDDYDDDHYDGDYNYIMEQIQ